MDSSRLSRLAELVQRRNLIDAEIATLIGRPALTGHLGEFIVAQVFDIDVGRREGFAVSE
jgi:hypothetical protein